MNRRLALFAAAIAAMTALVAPAAQADTASPTESREIPEVSVQQAERYWACVAVGYVDVGACVSNPLPDLSQYPTVPDTIHDLTGIRLPTVPRP